MTEEPFVLILPKLKGVSAVVIVEAEVDLAVAEVDSAVAEAEIVEAVVASVEAEEDPVEEEEEVVVAIDIPYIYYIGTLVILYNI